MPTKTLYRTAPYPPTEIDQLFTIFAFLLLVASAPKSKFSILLRTTFLTCECGLLGDETVFVRLTCKASFAASADGPKGCGTAGMTPSIKYGIVPHVCRDVQRYPHWKGVRLLIVNELLPDRGAREATSVEDCKRRNHQNREQRITKLHIYADDIGLFLRWRLWLGIRSDASCTRC